MVAEADRIIPVRLTNRGTGNTHKKEIHNPELDDFLDYIAELVTKMGGGYGLSGRMDAHSNRIGCNLQVLKSRRPKLEDLCDLLRI